MVPRNFKIFATLSIPLFLAGNMFASPFFSFSSAFEESSEQPSRDSVNLELIEYRGLGQYLFRLDGTDIFSAQVANLDEKLQEYASRINTRVLSYTAALEFCQNFLQQQKASLGHLTTSQIETVMKHASKLLFEAHSANTPQIEEHAFLGFLPFGRKTEEKQNDASSYPRRDPKEYSDQQASSHAPHKPSTRRFKHIIRLGVLDVNIVSTNIDSSNSDITRGATSYGVSFSFGAEIEKK